MAATESPKPREADDRRHAQWTTAPSRGPMVAIGGFTSWGELVVNNAVNPQL